MNSGPAQRSVILRRQTSRISDKILAALRPAKSLGKPHTLVWHKGEGKGQFANVLSLSIMLAYKIGWSIQYGITYRPLDEINLFASPFISVVRITLRRISNTLVQPEFE